MGLEPDNLAPTNISEDSSKNSPISRRTRRNRFRRAFSLFPSLAEFIRSLSLLPRRCVVIVLTRALTPPHGFLRKKKLKKNAIATFSRNVPVTLVVVAGRIVPTCPARADFFMNRCIIRYGTLVESGNGKRIIHRSHPRRVSRRKAEHCHIHQVPHEIDVTRRRRRRRSYVYLKSPWP